MTTARDLIQDALERIQVYVPSETATDADAARGFSVLNQMMDSWSNESLTCYEELEQNGAMVVGQSSYQIGAGAADFNTTRPLRIKDGPGAAYLLDTNGNKYGVNVRTRDQWNLIANPSQVTANVVTDIFYDPQYPVGIINVFPVPNMTWTLYWDSYLQFTRFATLASALSLPPGYEKAISENLAVDLAMYFPTAKITPSLVQAASRSKGNIKRTNRRENVAVYDRELIARGTGVYNVWSDRSG